MAAEWGQPSSPVRHGALHSSGTPSTGQTWTSETGTLAPAEFPDEEQYSNRQHESTYGYQADDTASQYASAPFQTTEPVTTQKSPYLAILAMQSYRGAAIFFMFFTFRGLHHFELAEQITNPVRSTAVKLMVSILIGGNVLGFLAGILSRRGLKIFMKSMLSLNMLWELADFANNFASIVLGRNMHVSKDEYISLMIWNALMVVVAGSCRKASWH